MQDITLTEKTREELKYHQTTIEHSLNERMVVMKGQLFSLEFMYAIDILTPDDDYLLQRIRQEAPEIIHDYVKRYGQSLAVDKLMELTKMYNYTFSLIEFD